MRIALRPSGGRGDYELAGTYNEIKASDLLEKRFFFQITPAITIDGRAVARRLSGKPRIRPDGGRHAYILISSILLLPTPRRELLKTPNASPQLQNRMYTVAGIDIDVLSEEPSAVVFAPKIVWAGSRGGLLRIDYASRMAVITALWSTASSRSTEIAALVRDHRAGVSSGDHDRIVDSAAAIRTYYNTRNDVLLLLLRDFGLPDAPAVASAGISDLDALDDFVSSEDDLGSASDSRRQRAHKWRVQADRGLGAREFSIRVREAYDYRCLFSGERFPKLPAFHSAGVDGAHILPWATYQLNAVRNGLCLCKLCHWAFDSGLLELDFDDAANLYLLLIPPDIEAAAVPAGLELARFEGHLGPIDPARFPTNQKFWPSVDWIREFNVNQ